MKPFDDELRWKLDGLLGEPVHGDAGGFTEIPIAVPEWFTERNFRKWVFSQRKWKCLGSLGSPMSCPIANFMKANGVSLPVVGTCLVSYVDGGRRYCFETAPWVSDFIGWLDYAGEQATGKRCRGYWAARRAWL
jgi:hypothetical protein